MDDSLLIHTTFCLLLCGLRLTSSFMQAGARLEKSSESRYIVSDQHSLRLIPSLKDDTGHIINNYSSLRLVAPRINEKKLVFPFPSTSGFLNEDLTHYAGYYRLPKTRGASMFYFLFESRNNKSDPVIIWLNGGPGGSSSIGLFYENGPFKITNNLHLIWNDCGWDKVSNIVYIDQPIGTGFSFTTNARDIRRNQKRCTDDLFSFLKAFFKVHAEFAENDIFIAGQSYAGHYIPAIASRIHNKNKKKKGILRNFKGFAIGNGLTNPAIQYPSYLDFVLQNKLIKRFSYSHERFQSLIKECEKSIATCETGDDYDCRIAYADCVKIHDRAISLVGSDTNYYDVREKCTGEHCYDYSNLENFLNEQSVKNAGGVGDIQFVLLSTVVNNAMRGDWMKNHDKGIPALLEDGIKVLIYAGDQDLICNWIGNYRWVRDMIWKGKTEFGRAENVSFIVDDIVSGELKNYGPLTFLKIFKCGHMVPMDQPKVALDMIRKWMQGKLTPIIG